MLLFARTQFMPAHNHLSRRRDLNQLHLRLKHHACEMQIYASVYNVRWAEINLKIIKIDVYGVVKCGRGRLSQLNCNL
jgi:hypothetical protein